MKRMTAVLMALMMAWVAQGCSSTGTGKTADSATATGHAYGRTADEGPEVGRYGGRSLRGAGAPGTRDLNDPSSPLSRRIIYFDYDSFDVMPDYVSVVTAHAGYLAAHPARAVTLEGHADERGSSEYNIALGEQRARAVAKLMTLQGVSDEQIQIVSYGEEKPAAGGHDEASWQQNRRVEIHYAGE